MHPQPPQPPARPQPPPRAAARQPTRVEPVPGTPYGLAIYGAPPTSSGPAVGSLVTGIAAVLVALAVACVGGLDALITPGAGFGLVVGGAFGLLAAFLGVAAIGLGGAALRQIRGARAPVGEVSGPPVRGRGMAVAGLACGGAALVIVVCAIGVALLAWLG